MKSTLLNARITKISLLVMFLLLNAFMFTSSFAQTEPPLVYDVENTGAGFPDPILPSFNDLPIIRPLTDPFEWSDGSGRDTAFASWSHRRSEIKTEIENYEIGPKPDASDLTITASYAPAGSNDGVLTVVVTRNSNLRSLRLTSHIHLPSGSGPFPAVIAMSLAPSAGANTGSLPSDIFTSRNIATIDYVHDDVTQYAAGQQISHAGDPYFLMYPEYNAGPCPPAGPCGSTVGQYSAWSWGVSRLIDGLEIASQQLVNPLPIDLKHLAVTGCSYAGKMALFAGAFDERIALTIAQESGGGGAPAWRVSETIGEVEKLGSTDHSWFMESMFQYAGTNVSRLPHDHHELMAMVAPRALLVTGNTDFEWLANPSCYVSARATQKIYNTFGIGDRFGFYIDGGHGHCATLPDEGPVIAAFVDKFLLGDMTANTDVQIHPYETVNYERWYQWWGTGDPSFPDINTDTAGTESIYFEAECASYGSDWEEFMDEEASNGAYVTVRSGLNSTESAPIGSESTIDIPFTVSHDTAYYLFGRVNCPSADDDSYWLKIDDGEWVLANGLATVGWGWAPLTHTDLTAGDHTLTITYREDGALLDKICITTYMYGPDELGDGVAYNCGGSTEPPEGDEFEGDDPSISRWKGWHEVEDERATNGYYSRNVNGHQGNEAAYLGFSFTGTEVDVQVARGPRGGDAEIFIDDVSQGMLSFFRPASDPNHPDKSGKKDLTFGITETYSASEGEHTFRLEVRNTQNTNGPDKQDIIYIDGFTIRSTPEDTGGTQGSGNPTELPTLITGTVDPTAIISQTVEATTSTQLITGILEVPEGANLDLIVLDPFDAVLGGSSTTGSLEVVHVTPSTAGSYLFKVVNKSTTSADFSLYQVLTQGTGQSLKSAESDATRLAKPTEFSLNQNYPNPFNPTTIISFAIPESGYYTLKVYNTLGQEVAELVSEQLESGFYDINFDGSGLASGIYIYSIKGNKVNISKKMILLR